MKKIGITQRLEVVESYKEIRSVLDIAWFHLFREFNAVLVPVPFDKATACCQELALDGLIFSGGNNLSAFDDKEVNRMRDQLETELLDFAIKNDIPVLGICRGAQFIAHRFGSLLGQVEGHVGTSHFLQSIGGEGRILTLEKEREVNSYHNFAITSLSENLVPLYQASDNTIEAFEHGDKSIVGIIWHPERGPQQIQDLKLIKKLFKMG